LKLGNYQAKSIRIYAPYAAYVLTIEVFFAIAMASDFISADRPSNWADICYLSYLPFCSLFVSSDKLHKLCAPYFLRSNQYFIWGIDFKEDLRKIDEYFKRLPRRVREKGIHAFAKFVPNDLELKFKQVWGMCTRYIKSDESKSVTPEKNKSLSKEIHNIKNSSALKPEEIDFEPEDIESLLMERRVHRRKGFWYQISKHVKTP